MIDKNHELTIGELDAVAGGESGILGVGLGAMELMNQIVRIIQGQNPAPPPTQSGPAQQFQQILNGLRPE